MNSILTFCILVTCIYYSNGSDVGSTPPHIIVMLADDMGWNDVGFHGSNQIPTPNIDALAYNGIILNNHYVQSLCTPSRAAFLTGKYPIHNGMQHLVILEPEPRGLPLNETLLPEYLKRAGYDTHIVGKWHLGYFRKEYTPTRRGFDSHYGYWNGLQDYFTHDVMSTFHPEMIGYDMRRNMDVDYSAKGKYSTEIFSNEAVSIISNHNVSKPLFLFLSHLAPHTGNIPNPFQAPDEEVAKFDYISDPERRVYAAMVSILDKSVGHVMKALRTKGMLERSIILFMSDNGAPTYGIHSNRGSNYPLKGQKDSPWEGGSRGVATIWSPLFNSMNRVSDHLMHVTDWLPTFWSAAGRDPKDLTNIDGISMWEVLKDDKPSPRVSLVHNIDDLIPYISIRHGEWKYVNGTTSDGKFDGNMGESGEISIEYDLKSVILSQTGSVLAGFTAERQMKEKRKNNETVIYTLKTLSERMIANLRRDAKITCTPNNMTSDGTNLPCAPLESPCLFNIKNDPCETVNLAAVRPIILASMEKMVAKYQESSVPASNLPMDLSANPSNHNHLWVNWKDEVVVKSIFDFFSNSAIISIGLLCAVLIFAVMIILVATLRKHKCYDRVFSVTSFSKAESGIMFRTFSTGHRQERRRSRARDAAMSAEVSVARRVEQFEDKEMFKARVG